MPYNTKLRFLAMISMISSSSTLLLNRSLRNGVVIDLFNIGLIFNRCIVTNSIDGIRTGDVTPRTTAPQPLRCDIFPLLLWGGIAQRYESQR